MIDSRIRRMEAFLNRLDAARGRRPSPPKRLQTIGDVIELLHEQVEAVRTESCAGTVEKARAIGYLAGIACKAIERGNLAARIEMLEAVLKQRNGGTPR